MEITQSEANEFNKTREKIRRIMHDLFNEDIADDFSKNKNDNWDSFTHLDLIVLLETEFTISFTPDEIGGIFSFEDLVSVISNKLDV